MTQKSRTTMDALGWIAFSESRGRDDVRSGVNLLRALYFPRARKVAIIGSRVTWVRRLATELLDGAAQIAESRSKRDSKRERLMRFAADRADYGLGQLHRLFIVRARKGSIVPRLEILGPDEEMLPLDAALFYVMWGFWSAVCDVPADAWRTFTLRKCVACDEPFRDLRPVMKHGPKTRCDECRKHDRRGS